MSDIEATDDLFADGIVPWANRVRAGALNFKQTVEHCQARVADNQELDAFECLDSERALATADALDALRLQGTDLGPLMGLPMGVKDIMVVEGLPTTNGSNADTQDINGEQGAVVTTLRHAGAITLGKMRTVEFALGATGVNESRGTPWNPVDRSVHRIPGGSSSGSAVATAAGLVGMALGTDTGGSVRIPACFTGIVGHKSSVGLWPLDGIFSLSPTLDSVGPLCRTVNDAALLHTIMTGEAVGRRPDLSGLRLGIVEDLFLDDLDEQVAQDFESACQLLEHNGAQRVRVSFPEVRERTALFTSIVPPELISFLTPERFSAIREGMDTVTAKRAAAGLDVSAHQYCSAQKRRQFLVNKACTTFDDVDVWMSPTVPFVPMPVAELSQSAGYEKGLLASRNTQPGNLLDMCGVSLPMHRDGLPTGLQLTMPLNRDASLLALARTIESVLAKAR